MNSSLNGSYNRTILLYLHPGLRAQVPPARRRPRRQVRSQEHGHRDRHGPGAVGPLDDVLRFCPP